MMRGPHEVRRDRRLAINGGRPHSLPELESGVVGDAAGAVAEAVRSGEVCPWRGGPAKRALEERFARAMGREHAYFFDSGTAALLCALRCVGEPGPRSIGVTTGHVSAMNAVYFAGARPVFLKTDPRTLVAEGDQALPEDRAPEGLLVTHFLGNGVDIEQLQRATGARSTIVDASQALGAALYGKPVGAMGDVVVFSGSLRKLLGAGKGGLCVLDDARVWERMDAFAHHGIDADEIAPAPGLSIAGSELEATLALAALDRLEARVQARRASAEVLWKAFGEMGIPCARPAPCLGGAIVWFKIGVVLPDDWLGHRDWLVDALRMEGVPAWRYPALIALPWVRGWMERMGWWGPWEREVLEHEQSIWNRVVTIETAMAKSDAARVANAFARVLTG